MPDNPATLEVKRAFKLGSRVPATRRVWTPDDFRPRPPGMGGPPARGPDAGPQPGRFEGYRLVASHLVPDTLIRLDSFNFFDVATPWERLNSALCNANYGGRGLSPVADETPLLRRLGMAAVVGHFGLVAGDELVCPDDVAGGSLPALIARGVPIFYLSRQSPLPPRWGRIDIAAHRLNVMTTVDGRLLTATGQGYQSDAEAEDGPIEFAAEWVIGDKLAEFAIGGVKSVLALDAVETEGVAARRVLAGPNDEVAALFLKGEKLAGRVGTVSEVGLERAMADRGLHFSGYERRMGIPRNHLQKMVEAARETNVVAVFRANKEAAIELIERGAVGKPKALSIPGFKSSETTGVLTAKTAEQVKLVTHNRYYMLEMSGGKPMMRLGSELKPLPRQPYWKVEEGQVLDAAGNPVVGDYDGLGALPLESPGRSLTVVPNDPLKGDWMGADWERYLKSVNSKLDRNRVLHGAQDGFPDVKNAGKYGGFVDGGAYAVFPDGRVIFLNGKAEQQAFYEAFERQTAVGSYNPKSANMPDTVDELAARRAAKKR